MFDALMGRIEGRFARVEPRRRARPLVLGLLSNLPRKNCWTIAEHTGDLGFYRCYSPAAVSLATLVRVAGHRWTVEETFQSGKGLAGLDQHQVRRWTSWRRSVTLAMLAHAFLAVTAAHEQAAIRPRTG